MKPTEHNTKQPSTSTGRFALLGALLRAKGTGVAKIARGSGASSPARVFATVSTALTMLAAMLLASAGLTAALPASASAYATIGGPPVYSSATGLPDGRVYEQVSPANKSGNEAGAGTSEAGEGSFDADNHFALAAVDGGSVLFEGTGAMGETASASNLFFVASKNEGAAGWSTRSALPKAQGVGPGESVNALESNPIYLDPSEDLSHVMAVSGPHYAPPPFVECGEQEPRGRAQLYLAGADPFDAATWLERPEIANPIESCFGGGESGIPVGGSPDFGTVYFTTPDTLLPKDEPRALHTTGSVEGAEAWGFYEYREGILREAGVLPDEGLDPFGAVPAESGHGPGEALYDDGNEVADEGKRAFFVSPDPASCEQNPEYAGANDCEADPPELYVRENGERTLLVSRDTLLPTAGGLAAGAPDGVHKMLNPTSGLVEAEGAAPELHFNGSYVFAARDGSHAFFQSEDRLTSEAPEGPSRKTYDFNLETEVLTYLPGVEGEIVGVDGDASDMAFVRPAAGGSPAELDVWSAGTGGGSVTAIAQLPSESGEGSVSEVRMSSEGSVVVFTTASRPSSAFNSGGFQQIYRYDVASNTLGCVSCAPSGVTPLGNAVMSQLEVGSQGRNTKPALAEPRGISASGERIFFDTPDPLVPQATNAGATIRYRGEVVLEGDDVYEWENGVVYLISGGKATRDSYYLDSSENGNDVFFATTEGLVPQDTDGAYDVYDARVPQPGDTAPAAAVPCKGSVCQGPPNVPSPLTPPASATFSGLGNVAPETAATPATSTKATTKKVKCKKGFTKKSNKCVKSKKEKTKARKASNDRRAGR